ncbi:MAG: hypothetical protein OXD54_09945 [Candidatus Poribacteria bacterium]|nr:hypothetical protein [Candidatus Poribacteria bacterium]
MNGTEKVIAHLQMIQANINRHGLYSFLVKGLSVVFVISTEVLLFYFLTIISTIGFIFIIVSTVQILLIIGFWMIDAYFLQQERLFCHHYDAIRQQNDTDLNMYVGIHKDKPKSSWNSVIFSFTFTIFYSIEIVLVLLIPAIGIYDLIF